MDQNACVERIAEDLAGSGVHEGDTLLVHSSFKSLGPVPGGIETVVRGLLRAIGDSGTLLMPALSWSLRPPEVFDVRRTRTNVGAVPESFRTRPGTLRSLHPTHSVCAVGRRAHEFLDEHRLDSTPCGSRSPFRRVTQDGGKILMLGCGLKPNTTMHALEEVAEAPYVLGQAFVFRVVDQQGNASHKSYLTHNFAGYRQRYDRVAELPDTSFLRRGRVLDAEVFLLDAPGLREAALRKMKEEPLFFVEQRG